MLCLGAILLTRFAAWFRDGIVAHIDAQRTHGQRGAGCSGGRQAPDVVASRHWTEAGGNLRRGPPLMISRPGGAWGGHGAPAPAQRRAGVWSQRLVQESGRPASNRGSGVRLATLSYRGRRRESAGHRDGERRTLRVTRHPVGSTGEVHPPAQRADRPGSLTCRGLGRAVIDVPVPSRRRSPVTEVRGESSRTPTTRGARKMYARPPT